MDKPAHCATQLIHAGKRRQHHFGRNSIPKSARPNAGTTPMNRPHYQRHRDLPGLLPLWPHELVITCQRDHEELLQRLRQALRAERRRGVSGHWCYNLTRHTNLLHAYHTEMKLFAAKWGVQ